ncbi:MAG: hypothetical protein HFACDABA_00622 [Anaerolineales bacterium]|nr:hypothetical protein [Anaerolineales bacterium]
MTRPARGRNAKAVFIPAKFNAKINHKRKEALETRLLRTLFVADSISTQSNS